MEEIKMLNDAGRQFLLHEEGLVRRPYLDQVGIPTIGIGMTYYPDTGKRVTMKDDPLSVEDVMKYFKMMLKPYELAVYSTTRDDLNYNEFGALVSFTYNEGESGFKNSTLRKNVNAYADKSTITYNFEQYKLAGGKPILLERRRREVKLFYTPDHSIVITNPYTDLVKMVQSKFGLTADGIFGKNTKAAVMTFQKKNGLIVDGIVGRQTLALLNKL